MGLSENFLFIILLSVNCECEKLSLSLELFWYEVNAFSLFLLGWQKGQNIMTVEW